jgi:hypothetical protein
MFNPLVCHVYFYIQWKKKKTCLVLKTCISFKGVWFFFSLCNIIKIMPQEEKLYINTHTPI